MELNREQIAKALECCQIRHINKACDDCYYHRWLDPICRGVLCEDALALIKELTEENERLKKDVADLQDELKCEKETNAHLCSQYMSENHLRHQAEEMLANGMSVVRADTVREMTARIKEYFPYDADSGLYVVLDQIAKELLEGEK